MNKGDLGWCPAQTLLIPSDSSLPDVRGPVKLILLKAMNESHYTKTPGVVFILGKRGDNLLEIVYSGKSWFVEEKNLYPINLYS